MPKEAEYREFGDDDIKLCPVCKREFLPKHGNQKYCSPECLRYVRSEYSRKYYREHRESILKRQREYDRKNRDGILKRQREYYRENRESILKRNWKYYRVYYRENRENILKRNREYYRKNRERISLCAEQHGNCFSCPYEDCIMQ